MDRTRVQTFRGEQLVYITGAAQIDRTDLRHHIGGDQHHQLVETRLRARWLRHDLTQAAKQKSRTAGDHGNHQAVSSSYTACSARTASSTYSSGINTLTLISEVDMTSRLMPFSA